MRFFRGLCSIVLLVVLVGCSSGPAFFLDEFSDLDSGWSKASTEMFIRGYDSGKYVIRIDVPNWFVWTTAGRTYKDVVVETMVRTEGATDNHYGVLCRASDEGFYYFAISTDGYYAIFRQVGEEGLTPLTDSAMLASPSIKENGATNRLMAVCEGTTLALYVNGVLVDKVEDDTFARGDVGMAAGTGRFGETTWVWFDDFEVTKPEE
jgi:hypothetical protein